MLQPRSRDSTSPLIQRHMAKDQSYGNHRRYYPWHHFVVQPILLMNVAIEIKRVIQEPSSTRWWAVILAIGLLVFSFTARGMSLRAQDRVIRLEELLRLSRLPVDQAAVDSLRPGQLIALRFASDDEVPDLVRRINAGELTKGEEIKKAIRAWKPDYLRV
jgi:hypothetical protein